MYRVIKQEQEASQRYEKNNGVIVTVPDQVEGINEMLTRFRRGELATKKPVFNNESELPDLRKMDLVDVDNLKRDLNNTISNEKQRQQKVKRTYNETKKKIEAQKSERKNDSGDPSAGTI